jgi:hypothetical protein
VGKRSKKYKGLQNKRNLCLKVGFNLLILFFRMQQQQIMTMLVVVVVLKLKQFQDLLQ